MGEGFGMESNVKYFCASEKGSFAEFTVKNRFPKIYGEYCSGTYNEFESLKIDDVFNTTNNEFNFRDFADCLISSVNTKIGSDFSSNTTLHDFFYNAPFFEAEVLFYHALLAQKKYFETKFDFFATEKNDSVMGSKESFIEHLDSLVTSIDSSDKKTNEVKDNSKERDELINAIHYCLSANTSDLSQLNAKERFDYTTKDIKILHDDSIVLYNYLSKNEKPFERFDIICDNAGKELFSDLYLACYFLCKKYVKKVVFHLKSYPYFVSDATKLDFGFLVNSMMSAGTGEGAKKCSKFIQSKMIEIKDDYFWTKPLPFLALERENKDLFNQLKTSDLIILKGDLNYRRLIEDKNWTYTDSFEDRTKDVFGNAPILAPRVLKSDVLIGISDAAYFQGKSTDKFYASPDQCFKGNGKWAVIHFRIFKKIKENKKKNTKCGYFCEKKEYKKTKKEKSKSKKAIFRRLIHDCISYCTAALFVCSTLVLLIILFRTVFTGVGSKKIQDDVQTEIGVSEELGSHTRDTNATVEKKFVKGFINSLDEEDVKRIDFSMLLSGYVLFLTASFLVPRYFLKQEAYLVTDEIFKERVPKLVGEKVTEKTKTKMSEILSTEKKLDGDLSRMVSFLLINNDINIWGVGWAFHSLKSYIKIEKIDRNDEVVGFVDLLFNTVIKKSMIKICEDLKKQEFNNDKGLVSGMYPHFKATNDVSSDITKLICMEAKKSGETKPELPILRLIKDAVDIEFGIRLNTYNWNVDSEIYSKVKEISKYIGCFIRYLSYNFIYYPYDSEKTAGAKKRLFVSKEDFAEKIYSLSKIKNNQELCKNYKKVLFNTIDKIYTEGILGSRKKLTTNENFFLQTYTENELNQDFFLLMNSENSQSPNPLGGK